MSRHTILTALLMAGLVATAMGVYFGYRATEPRTSADTTVATFYSSKLPDANDTPLDLTAFRDQLVTINFWAPWCGLYVEGIPELSALAQEQKTKARLIGISIDSALNTQTFLGKIHVAYPITVAGSSGTGLGHQLGNEVGGLPFIMILNTQGEITFREMGRVHVDELHETLQRI